MSVFNEETQYLDKVLEVINEEIDYSKKDLMRKLIEGKTLSSDDKKRGAHFNVNNDIERLNRRIDTLTRVKPSPYFGRMDFKPMRESEYEKLYIGRTGLLDECGKQLIIDWRAPIASMFYNDSCGIVSYESPSGIIIGNMNLKRQLVIEDEELKKILDTDVVTNDEILQEYLNVHADDRMKDIIASIQQEQNDIIRADINKDIIVQGVAGSGKTSVALHRIAYLLYNVKNSIGSDKFLLLGPNKYFLNYISSVLPELEVEPIKQKRFLDFASDYLNEKISIKDGTPKTKLKNSEEKITEFNKYKNSLSYMKSIESFVEKYLKGDFIDKGIEFAGVEVFDTDYVKDAITSGVISKLNYEKAKNMTIMTLRNNRDNIYRNLNEEYQEIYRSDKYPKDVKREAYLKSSALHEVIYKQGEKIIKAYYKSIDKKIVDIYKMFLQNSDKYLVDLSDADKKKFKELFSSKAGIFKEDLAALIYIKYLITGKTFDYRQVAIDEAQDYGMFTFYTLKKVCPNAHFSIYGDLAQSVYPYADLENWENVGTKVFDDKYDLVRLSKGYRTTSEITKNANPVLENLGLNRAFSVDRHGPTVEYVNKEDDSDYLLSKLCEWLDKGYKSIGIICKTDKEAIKLFEQLDKLGIKASYLDDNNTKYEGGINIGTCLSVKGLEFDAVIVNDASEKIYDSNNNEDMHLLYVALTRALHELSIQYSSELCNVLKPNVKENIKTLTLKK